MATFRKRGNWWSYRIDMGINPITNKRIQPTFSKSEEYPNGFKTKDEAKKAATKHQNELDQGTYVKMKEVKFVTLAEEWFKYYCKGRKISTQRVRKYELLRLTKFFEFDLAKNINKKRYQEFLDHMEEETKLMDATRVGTHLAAKMLFAYALEFGYMKIDPTEYTKVHRAQATVEDIENNTEIPKYLEKEQLALFLKTAQTKGLPGDYMMFLTLAYSGMRDGELCALKKTDFDKVEKTVSITKTNYNPSCKVIEFTLLPPKNKGSIRKIELDEIIFIALEDHLAKQNELKMRYRKTYYDKGFIFALSNEFPGYPTNIDFVGWRMSRLLKLAKLDENLTPHSLRHTHTSLLAEAGVPLEDIMDRLGHVDDKTTKNVYMHVTKKRKKEASQKFGELMKNLSISEQ